jgi:hypothetical protein
MVEGMLLQRDQNACCDPLSVPGKSDAANASPLILLDFCETTMPVCRLPMPSKEAGLQQA